MNENTTPERTVWPSGQAGWYNHAKRCSWVTKLTPEGYAETWCAAPIGNADHFCTEHRGTVDTSKAEHPHLWRE